MKPYLAFALLPLVATSPALADIYTWSDKSGVTHVSNLPPPEDAKVLRVTRTAPRDPEREAAMREAARQAEIRVLDERLRQVAMELEESRRQPPPPPVVVIMPPAPAYYAPPPAPTIVNVVAPAAPSYGGCDYGWGDCGFGLWSGYPVVYPSFPVNTWFGRGGKFPRRTPTPHSYNNGHLIPPLIPLPTGHGWRKG